MCYSVVEQVSEELDPFLINIYLCISVSEI